MKAVLFVSLLAATVFLGCTIFSASKDGVILAGNNEDWYLSYIPMVVIKPPAPGWHGRIMVGFRSDRSIQGGMNDAGLFIDGAMTPPDTTPYDFNKKTEPGFDKLLGTCATVEDAIAFYGRYNVAGAYHPLIADKTGSSAVIEWLDGEMRVIRKTESFQVATNFLLTKPQLGGYPCRRFNTVTMMLSGNPTLSVDLFKDILSRVANKDNLKNRDNPGTIYSQVYDLTNCVMYLWFMQDFKKCVAFDLAKEFEKGSATYTMDELFGGK